VVTNIVSGLSTFEVGENVGVRDVPALGSRLHEPGAFTDAPSCLVELRELEPGRRFRRDESLADSQNAQSRSWPGSPGLHFREPLRERANVLLDQAAGRARLFSNAFTASMISLSTSPRLSRIAPAAFSMTPS